MKIVVLHSAVALVMLSALGPAHALDFKSVGAAPAVLYDAPSQRGKKVFVAPRNMPVEVILSYGEWSKIRDAAGDLSWVESKALAPKRFLMVRSAVARVHSSADESAAVVFGADKGVVLELLEGAPSGWSKVRHRDGLIGFVRNTDVWGA